MQVGAVVAGRFHVESLAGRGGMGSVWRARDAETGDTIALKVLADHEGDDERFLREARLLAELRHPGIVRYVAHGVPGDGQLYLAMEWLEGEDVGERLSSGRLSLSDSLLLVQRAAEALAVAHAQGVVHRDIKPNNLFLPGGDVSRVKLLDFGIARNTTRATRALTAASVVLGTPGYMAPEQVNGERAIDARADVFALGCVLFECLSGQPAFYAEHPMAILVKILLEEAPRVRELVPDAPLAVEALVSRMLSKNPAERPADARAVASEIEKLDREAAPKSQPVARSAALTGGEKRLFSVVLVGGDPELTSRATMLGPSAEVRPASKDASTRGAGSLPPTLAPHESEELEVHAIAKTFDARLERLVGGSFVLTLAGGGAATDQAAKAAKCALRVRASQPDGAIALATGWGMLAARWPVGEVIDRAAELLRAGEVASREAANGKRVRIDEVTAGLLDGRFEVGGDSAGLHLTGEHDAHETGRTLLGKATDCVGRDREIAMLDATFAECADESIARAVLLTAPPGVGKSRLRQEWQRRLAARGEQVEVLLGRGDMMSAGSPFALIAPAIRRLCGVHEGEPLEVRRLKLRARVSRHLRGADASRVVEFIGEIAGTPFPSEDSVQLRAARQDPMLMGDQMRRAWIDFLGAECGAQPVVIVLEDVHWGDLPSVGFIDAALRTLSERPLFVLATARPEVHDVFPKLWKERSVQEIPVTGLGKRAAERLVAQVLGSGVAAEVVARIVEQAAGNAFYLEELIRAVADGKGSSLPGTVLAMVQGRLESSEPDARRILRAASVFGESFWAGGVVSLLGGAQQLALANEWLEELERRELVAKRGTGKFHREQEFAFRHATVREAAYAMLTDADRTLGHRLAGEWLEGAGESDAMVLAEHFDRGGETMRAIASYQRAAEQALEANDFAAAVARAERGVALGAAGETLGALRAAQAAGHRWRGEHPEAQLRGKEALALLPAGSDRWYACVVELAMASDAVGSFDDLADVAGDLARQGSLVGARGVHVVAALYTVAPLVFAGRRDVVAPFVDEVHRIDVGSLAEDPVAAAQVHYTRAFVDSMIGDLGAAIDQLQAAVDHQIRAGDLRTACMNGGNLGFLLVECGCYIEAERALRDALPNAKRMGLGFAIANITSNLGLAVAHQGDVQAAIALEAEAIELLRAQEHRRLEVTARVYLSLILLRSGDAARASVEAEAAVSRASTDVLRLRALPAVAQVRLATGQPDAALEAAVEATSLLNSVGTIEEGESLLRLVLAEAYEATGRRQEAREALESAWRRLAERARQIGDRERRNSFLSAVVENSRTMALARAAGIDVDGELLAASA